MSDHDRQKFDLPDILSEVLEKNYPQHCLCKYTSLTRFSSDKGLKAPNLQ
jgi:hypothetical protein